MHLRPRHLLLIALIVILGVYNIARLRRPRRAEPSSLARHSPVISGPRLESPAWDAFDRAGSLRDAPAPQFQPALDAFHKQTSQGTTPDPDLQGCSTWLEFYRQGVLHPSRDPSWKDRSTEHLDSCMKHHRDLSS